MAERDSAEARLARLRELILNARSIPVSALCLVNRQEVLRAIDEVVQHLPEELAEAQQVIDESQATFTEGEAGAERIVSDARARAVQLAEDSEVAQVAEELAAKVRAEAETEAAALLRETDVFVEARMASFESVLDETASQVRTARLRLSERSELDRRR